MWLEASLLHALRFDRGATWFLNHHKQTLQLCELQNSNRPQAEISQHPAMSSTLPSTAGRTSSKSILACQGQAHARDSPKPRSPEHGLW